MKNQPVVAQGEDGNWWSQDPGAGDWQFWNGQSWQATQQLQPSIKTPGRQPSFQNPHPRHRAGLSSLVIALLVGGLILVFVVGGVSLVALQFIPGAQIQPDMGATWQDVLLQFGGGALVGLVGFLVLRSGIKSVITRHNIVEDEWGNRQEQRGCAAVASGVFGSLLGLLMLTAGWLLAAVSVYQQILPLLGF
jgi:hypothetical protein